MLFVARCKGCGAKRLITRFTRQVEFCNRACFDRWQKTNPGAVTLPQSRLS